MVVADTVAPFLCHVWGVASGILSAPQATATGKAAHDAAWGSRTRPQQDQHHRQQQGVPSGCGRLTPAALWTLEGLFQLVDLMVTGQLPPLPRPRLPAAATTTTTSSSSSSSPPPLVSVLTWRPVGDQRSLAAFVQFVWDAFANAAGSGGGDDDDDDAQDAGDGVGSTTVSRAQLRRVAAAWTRRACGGAAGVGATAAEAAEVAAMVDAVFEAVETHWGVGGSGSGSGGGGIAVAVRFDALVQSFALFLRKAPGYGAECFDPQLGDYASLEHVLQGHGHSHLGGGGGGRGRSAAAGAGAAVTRCVLAPSSGLLLTASADGGEVRLWDTRAQPAFLAAEVGGGGGGSGRGGRSGGGGGGGDGDGGDGDGGLLPLRPSGGRVMALAPVAVVL